LKVYLSIPLPEKLDKRVRRFAEIWQPGKPADPHITIAIPRELPPQVPLRLIAATLQVALRHVKKFTVNTGIVGTFKDRAVVYVGVERSEGLVECHRTIKRVLDQLIEPDYREYSDIPKPHITLVKDVPHHLRNKVWEEAVTKDWITSFCCEKVNLMVKRPDDQQWSIYAALQLR
jgi:2'-5' RNA ligase